MCKWVPLRCTLDIDWVIAMGVLNLNLIIHGCIRVIALAITSGNGLSAYIYNSILSAAEARVEVAPAQGSVTLGFVFKIK